MKKAALRLVILAAAAASAGCGDSWPRILNNELSLLQEYVDGIMKVVDEDSAKLYKEVHFERIKNAWSDVQKRKELYVKLRFNSIVADIRTRDDLAKLKIPEDVKEEFAYSISPNFVREVLSIKPRLQQQLVRIQMVISRLQAQGEETSNLQRLLDYHQSVFGAAARFLQL